MQLLYTAIVAEGSGKLNGTVFSRNAYGPYARTKVSPSNPQTDPQMDVRSKVVTLSQDWATLTDPQRSSWNEFGNTFKSINPFGQAKKIAGIAAFVRSNVPVLLNGDTRLDDAPADFSAESLVVESLAVIAATGLIRVVYTPTPASADTRLMIFATPPISGAKMSVSNLERLAVVSALAPASPCDLAYPQARLGTLVAGQRIGLSVYSYNRTNGAESLVKSSIVTVS